MADIGCFSEIIHKPDISRTFVMYDEDETFKQFMFTIASLSDTQVKVIDSDSARSAQNY